MPSPRPRVCAGAAPLNEAARALPFTAMAVNRVFALVACAQTAVAGQPCLRRGVTLAQGSRGPRVAVSGLPARAGGHTTEPPGLAGAARARVAARGRTRAPVGGAVLAPATPGPWLRATPPPGLGGDHRGCRGRAPEPPWRPRTGDAGPPQCCASAPDPTEAGQPACTAAEGAAHARHRGRGRRPPPGGHAPRPRLAVRGRGPPRPRVGRARAP